MSKQPQPKPTNRFHEIRQREFKREQLCATGYPADVTPSYFTPSLTEICAQTIANNFETQTNIDGLRELDEKLYLLITDQLRTDLKLDVSVPRLKVDDYWRACCEARWSLGELTEYTKTSKLTPPEKGGWKRVYLERNLEERLMSIETSTMSEKDEEDMVSLCSLCGSEIYSLNLTRQRAHFDITELFQRLPQLESFSVSFGVLNAGVTFNLDMVGLKQQDALNLQKVLRSPGHLSHLALPENAIDDDLCKAIIAGLVRNRTLTHLDLSHNRISDEGASKLGLVLLQKDIRLRTVDLSDNQIRDRGAKALGQALAVNTTLTKLSLRMNRMGDVGGEMLFDGVRANKALTQLDMSANNLGEEAARALISTLGDNDTLLELNISCNNFGEDGGQHLLEAAKGSKSVMKMDVRMSKVLPSEEERIVELMQKRVYAKHMEQVDTAEARTRAEHQQLVAEKLRKTHGQ